MRGWQQTDPLKHNHILTVSRSIALGTRTRSCRSFEWEEYDALHRGLSLHPNIVKLLGICIDFLREDCGDRVLTMLMPLYEGGCLRDYVLKTRHERPLNAAELFAFALPMAKAVGHLHTSGHRDWNKYVHKDLALRNFVLTADLEPVLIDFGMAANCCVRCRTEYVFQTSYP